MDDALRVRARARARLAPRRVPGLQRAAALRALSEGQRRSGGDTEPPLPPRPSGDDKQGRSAPAPATRH